MTRRGTKRSARAALTWASALCQATPTGWHFQLPTLTSANRLWRRGKGRTYKAKNAAKDGTTAARLFGRIAPLQGDVAVRIVWVRKIAAGDVDNRVKATLDTLRGIAYGDDRQVARLEVERVDDVTTPAGLYVWVEPIGVERRAA